MSRPYATCPRCGLSREVKPERDPDICGDCKLVEPAWPKVRIRRDIALCGTDSGYYRHIRTLGEMACDTCLKAHREAELTRQRHKGVRTVRESQQDRRRDEAGRYVVALGVLTTLLDVSEVGTRMSA